MRWPWKSNIEKGAIWVPRVVGGAVEVLHLDSANNGVSYRLLSNNPVPQPTSWACAADFRRWYRRQ